MALSHSTRAAQSRLALAHRYGRPAAELGALRSDYGRLVRADTVREVLTADPPVTPDEARSLVALIRAAVVT